MRKKQPARISEKMIEKIYVESDSRDGSYIMPTYHCHPYFELYYVEAGACRFLIEEDMYDLHAGDFLLIPPNVLHYTRYLFGVCQRANLFFLESDIEPAVRDLLPQAGQFFSRARVFQVPSAQQKPAGQLILRMLQEEKIGDDTSILMLHMMLQELFLFCSRECLFPEEPPANIHTTDSQIVRAACFIASRYMDPITAADIAGAAGYSPNYLSRRFRQAVGIGVHQYLMFIRLQHAAHELVSTGDSITEIALRCGFVSSNYFKDAFKEAYGIGPREYRRIEAQTEPPRRAEEETPESPGA